MLTEDEALRLIENAVEQMGGPRYVVGSPRHPFSMNPREEVPVEGHDVTIHFSEISSPAIAEVEGWIFEIRDTEYVVLQKPRPKKA
jgi:hypothetical protein